MCAYRGLSWLSFAVVTLSLSLFYFCFFVSLLTKVMVKTENDLIWMCRSDFDSPPDNATLSV